MPSFVLNVTTTPEYMQVFEFEKYDHQNVRVWLENEGSSFVIYASMFYMLCIWSGQKYMKNKEPFQLKKYLIFWNVLQATLSAIIFIRMSPELHVHLKENSLQSTFCTFGTFHNIATNFWGVVFCLSKLLDFGDTVFLVLTKKPVRFLHWYHHVSVAIYCIFAADWSDPATRWFSVVNSAIHFIMYTYYALMAMRIRVPRSLAMSITALQLAQMVFGIYINVTSYNMILNNIPCNRPIRRVHFALAMYISYFILFSKLFFTAYVAPILSPERRKSKSS